MALTAIAAASQILASALKSLESLREQAKNSKDAGVKENISKLYDSFLDLKSSLLRVEEENGDLRRKVAELETAEKPEIRQVGETHYYYVGEKGPYCQPCFNVQNKLIPLMPLKHERGSGSYRRCEVCKTNFWERPGQDDSTASYIDESDLDEF